MDINLWEELIKTYGPKLKAVATNVYNELKARDWEVSEPCEMNCNTYSWNLQYFPLGQSDIDSSIDISFEMLDASDYDGTENGMSFAVNMVEYGGRIVGGRIVGGFHLYNYTDRCWVDPRDSSAVEQRWDIFEGPAMDAEEIDSVIRQFRRKR